MFDAKYLDNIAKSYVFAIADRRLRVGKKMVEHLNWDNLKKLAEEGNWTMAVKARDFSGIYISSLLDSEFSSHEVKQITQSLAKDDAIWAMHFSDFANEMEILGYEITLSWEQLSTSKYEYEGKNHFSAEYSSKRNLWVKEKRGGSDGFWGRPTMIISWGTALQLEDAIKVLREKEDTTVGMDDDFLTRF
ncbi:MAG: hypothetical protein CMP53_09015 [Flavobacteriales bacterium]|nr:hypothetical protein [Flavobacteriales bacterium]|tara:strand:- start:198 stop:767 length:570 start_codon:yes stop_codon:yes gene_type:complete